MAEPTKSQEIAEAYEKGTLLVHLFEFNNQKKPEMTTEFFDVLTGKPGALFQNLYHDAMALAGQGYLGLPTTAIKKDHPIKLYYQPEHYTGIGILMHSDSEHVDPLFVSSSDAYSCVTLGQCRIMSKETRYPELREIQEFSNTGSFRFNLLEDRPARAVRGRQALSRMWELLDRDHDASKPNKELNEVLVRAHAKGVKALVIDEGPIDGVGFMDRNIPMTPELFAARVEKVKKLNAWLVETYPEDFPEPLPVFAYNKIAEKQLVELTEEQLRTGDMPDHGTIRWTLPTAVNRYALREGNDGVERR